MAWDDGIRTVIVTPHQLGMYRHVRGLRIRAAADELQQYFRDRDLNLVVLPGADVRIEADMIRGLRRRDVLTLADRGRHVLLELPHEIYVPMDQCLDQLRRAGLVGILSHPERNHGLLRCPDVIPELIDRGCLMQVTAASLLGGFGPKSQALARRMLEHGWVHFLATDAHGHRARRPLLGRAYCLAARIAGEETASAICCQNPARIVAGQDVVAPRPGRFGKRADSWWKWRRAA